jgi:hypothetical protein
VGREFRRHSTKVPARRGDVEWKRGEAPGILPPVTDPGPDRRFSMTHSLPTALGPRLKRMAFAVTLFAAAAAPALAESIDMNKIHEQWGMKTDKKAKFWMDDPKAYAAAQQVDQKAVSGAWGKKLMVFGGLGLVVAYVFLKSRE